MGKSCRARDEIREGGLGLREASVMSASAAASVKARSVFREFFRKARLFEDDNMREWVKRKTRESFRGTLTANGTTSVEELFKRAEEELRMLERTSTMYKMYKPRHPTILDVKK